MSEFEQLYREVILDHYKAPRNHGLLDPADAVAEGQNPLCGDEIRVTVRFGEGDVLEQVGFEGQGCAISQAATSMLSELVTGRTAQEIAVMPKEELLEEIGIPLTPVAQVCAARTRSPEGGPSPGQGHAAPRRVGRAREWDHPLLATMPEVEVLPTRGVSTWNAPRPRARGARGSRRLQLRWRVLRDRGSLHPRRRETV